MALAKNWVPMEPPSGGLLDVLGGVLAEIPETVKEVVVAREVSRQVRESRQQLFLLALVLGIVYLATR